MEVWAGAGPLKPARRGKERRQSGWENVRRGRKKARA